MAKTTAKKKAVAPKAKTKKKAAPKAKAAVAMVTCPVTGACVPADQAHLFGH